MVMVSYNPKKANYGEVEILISSNLTDVSNLERKRHVALQLIYNLCTSRKGSESTIYVNQKIMSLGSVSLDSLQRLFNHLVRNKTVLKSINDYINNVTPLMFNIEKYKEILKEPFLDNLIHTIEQSTRVTTVKSEMLYAITHVNYYFQSNKTQ